MMGTVGINGAMHPGGLFYSTATIRQELERIAGGWPERAASRCGRVGGRLRRSVPRLRHDPSRTRPPCATHATTADAAADALFRGAGVVVVTLGLIETWRSPHDREHVPADPAPGGVPDAGADVPPADRRRDARRPRADPGDRPRHARGDHGRDHLTRPAPHDVHGARRPGREHRIEEPDPRGRLRVRRSPSTTSTTSTRTRWWSPRNARATTSATTAGTSIATRSSTSCPSSCACSPSPSLHLTDVDATWLTPIEKTAAIPTPGSKATGQTAPSKPPVPRWRRTARRARRRVLGVFGRA